MDEKKPYKVPESPENRVVDFAFETMLKKFIRQVEKEGILREVKARRYFHKPSELKRLRAKDKKLF